MDVWCCTVTVRRESGEVVHGAERLELDEPACRVLDVMVRTPGRVVTMRELGHALDEGEISGTPSDVRQCMHRIMRKLNRPGCQHIVAVPGVGYAFMPRRGKVSAAVRDRTGS